MVKIYDALLRNHIETKIKKILRKNQNDFWRNRSTTSQILTIFYSINRGEMEQILFAYGLLKETVTVIMMLYKNTKVKVLPPDGDMDYFDIVAGVLQGDKLAPYLFIICLDYVFRMSIDLMKENGFNLAKERSRRYPAQIIMNTDYTNDIVLLANSPARAKSLLHSLEPTAAGIGLHVNTDIAKYMYFNQRGDTSTLKGGPLKLVDKFTYIGSNVSSTEVDINMRLAKAWTAIDRLSVTQKSDLTDKIKQFFPSSSYVDTSIWMHYMDAN